MKLANLTSIHLMRQCKKPSTKGEQYLPARRLSHAIRLICMWFSPNNPKLMHLTYVRPKDPMLQCALTIYRNYEKKKNKENKENTYQWAWF